MRISKYTQAVVDDLIAMPLYTSQIFHIDNFVRIQRIIQDLNNHEIQAFAKYNTMRWRSFRDSGKNFVVRTQ